VSGTDYNKRAGYLKGQEYFQDNDLIREEMVYLQRWWHGLQESSVWYSQFGLRVISGLGGTGHC